MTDDAQVLDYLREQFARVNTRLADRAQWQAEAGRRLVSIERHIAAVRRDAVLDTEDVVSLKETVGLLRERLERLERRLDLAS